MSQVNLVHLQRLSGMMHTFEAKVNWLLSWHEDIQTCMYVYYTINWNIIKLHEIDRPY